MRIGNRRKLEKDAQGGSIFDELLSFCYHAADRWERSDRDTQFDFYRRDFDNYYADLLSRADAAKARLQSASDEILRKTKQRKKLNAFMSELENRGDLLTGFDEELFAATVEKITVYPKKLTFLFKDGSDIDTAL